MPDFQRKTGIIASVALVILLALLQIAPVESNLGRGLDDLKAQLHQLQELIGKLPEQPPPRPSFLFGMPTVSRQGAPSPYLKETLATLLLPNDFPFDFKILVFLAELPADYRDTLRRDLLRSFPKQVLSNKLMIIEIPDPAAWYHPALYTEGSARCQLKRNYGDSMRRVLWRSKLVMDFAFILAQAAAICEEHHLTHYIHLEDDVRLENLDHFVSFTKNLQAHPITTENSPWFFISLAAHDEVRRADGRLHPYQLLNHFAGLFGLVLNPRYLKDMSDYFVAHFDEMPADWLISEYYTQRLNRQPATLVAGKVFVHAGQTSSKSDVDNIPAACTQDPPASGDFSFVCWRQCDVAPGSARLPIASAPVPLGSAVADPLWPPLAAEQRGSATSEPFHSVVVCFRTANFNLFTFRRTALREFLQEFTDRRHLHLAEQHEEASLPPDQWCTGTPPPAALQLVITVDQQQLQASGQATPPPGATERAPSGSNEWYRIVSSPTALSLQIDVISHWGLVRALQTLDQLLSLEKTDGAHTYYHLVGLPLNIVDYPDVAYRGVLIDVARNYYPLPLLKRLIDFMAAAKLNALHLHLTDDQGFMIAIEDLPRLGKPPVESGDGARIYSVPELTDLVEYGRLRGVRLIPELTMPGHAAAWTLPVPSQPDVIPHCPGFACSVAWSLPLNPYVNRTFVLIEHVLKVVAAIFPDEYLHLGGDELVLSCYQEAGISDNALKTFEERLRELVKQVIPTKKIIRWEETFAVTTQWDTCHLWKSDPLRHDTCSGKPLLISSGWYIDYAKQCTSASTCYTKEVWPKARPLDHLLGVEISLWEMTPSRFFQSDVHSQILGFAGAAWRFTNRPAWNRAAARQFCTFLASHNIVDTEFQCHLHEESGGDYHSRWRREFQIRERDRDTLICHRQDPNRACTTPNCRRPL